MSSTGEKTVLLKSKKKTRHASKTESETDHAQSSVLTLWEELSGTTKVVFGAAFFGLGLFILSYFVNLKQTIAGDIAKYSWLGFSRGFSYFW